MNPTRILRLEALLLLAALVALYWWLHVSWIIFVVLILAPDVAMLGYLRNTRIGAMSYNAFHSYVGPLLLATAAAFSRALLPFAVIWATSRWTAHWAMDSSMMIRFNTRISERSAAPAVEHSRGG